LRTLNGDRLTVLITIAFPPESAALESVLVSLMDITERNRTQEALQQAQAELAHVTRLTTLGELTASIAHEVNQPLAAIVTNGEACLRWLGYDPPQLGEVRSGLESMISDGVRASEVVWGLRALSKKTDPQRIRLSLNDVIDQVILLVQREVLNHRVSLRLELARARRLWCSATGSATAGDHESADQRDQAMAAVTDRPRASCWSDRSGQARRSRADRSAGHRRRQPGKHEPVVQRVLHHQAERDGNGIVDLPLHHRSTWGPDMGVRQCRAGCDFPFYSAVCPEELVMPNEAPELQPIVFVIDDDASLRNALTNLFRSVGLRAEVFASAPELLQSKLPDVPSCLVLDVRLPGLSGLDFQAELSKANIHIPIIFMTGHGDIPMTVRAMKAGAVDFLPNRSATGTCWMPWRPSSAIESDGRRRGPFRCGLVSHR
jgi:CheY-like chemotaxis protein